MESHGSVKNGRREHNVRVREGLVGAVLLVLVMEEGQGRSGQAPLEAGKEKGTESTLELPGGTQRYLCLDWNPVRLILDF